MTINKLMLNENKTEVICISSNYINDQVSINQFSVDDTIVIPASSLHNISVMFDNTMSMKNQVTSLCKVAHFHLRNIGRIRKSITYEACEKLIHALITSRLDYCNATLYGVTDGQHQRLQMMFNIAARILMLTPLSEDIERFLLETLHWLLVEQRIQYKILLLTFKVHNISQNCWNYRSQSRIPDKRPHTDYINLWWIPGLLVIEHLLQQHQPYGTAYQ